MRGKAPSHNIFIRDMIWVFNKFFDKGMVDKTTNKTFICLLKKTGARRIKLFMSISLALANSFAKIIPKTSAKGIKQVLPSTISPKLGDFVKRRQILDYVVIAKERRYKFKHRIWKGLWPRELGILDNILWEKRLVVSNGECRLAITYN